jgi:fimbrial chaperone protein
VQGTDTAGQPYEHVFTGDDISRMVGVAYLAPAGGRRVFNIPTGKALDPSKPVSLRFD